LSGQSLELLQRECKIVIVTGQGAFEAPHNSILFSELLQSKSIPHLLDVWGHDVRHDWPWWRKMLPYHLEKLGF
jgi:esterase/lipase superfamily enzyme